MTTPTASSAGALYYPYIHIEDSNWLRANLVIFPFVQRMLPMNYTPQDNPTVRQLTESFEGRQALLRPANLRSKRSISAQLALAKKLRRDLKNKAFLARYGQGAARELAGSGEYGFQIHVGKLSPELRDALTHSDRLAWKPVAPEPWDGPGYLEVHPRVGEAVMSTLAVACAQAEGLDIVGDKRSGPLHECLLEKDSKSIYDAWLDPDAEMQSPKQATAEELFEFIIGFEGDPSKLSIEKLYALAEERESIDALINTVRDHAARIPTMDEGPGREYAFKQAAATVMDKWDADRKNFSRFIREFFDVSSAKLGSDFLTKIADKTLTGLAGGAGGGVAAAAAAGTTTASSAGWLGSLASGGVIGAGAGLVIGLIMHGATTYVKQHRRERNSPYRFLTNLEHMGVIMRGEVR